MSTPSLNADQTHTHTHTHISVHVCCHADLLVCWSDWAHNLHKVVVMPGRMGTERCVQSQFTKFFWRCFVLTWNGFIWNQLKKILIFVYLITLKRKSFRSLLIRRLSVRCLREQTRKMSFFTCSYILRLQDVGCYGKHLFLYFFLCVLVYRLPQ